MGTHRISAEDVVDYLAKLPAGQKRPSLRELQVALGGGSLDTLGRGMREFLKRQEETANVPEDFAAAGSELTTLDVILPLAKQLLREVDYEHHPIRLIGLSVSNPRGEEEEGKGRRSGQWEQLSFEFGDWE